MTPLVIAHRGACWDAPENTIEAFELAIAEKADYVEFDVRKREGELVICHDPTPPPGLPTLDEVLAALAGRVGLAVEIKEPETTGRVLEALRRHGVETAEALVVSFHAAALETVRRVEPKLRCVLHVGQKPLAVADGYWAVGLEEPAAPERIAEAHAQGFATTVFTVNDPDRMLELARLGVTGLFTDRPGLARRVLQTAR
jgi:glycerophosphoryl diester phosphodiesterase